MDDENDCTDWTGELASHQNEVTSQEKGPPTAAPRFSTAWPY